MTVWTLGSINADHVYAVPHLPAPGETLSARALSSGLGGKGANQSVAAARAGAQVRHIGAVGADGRWTVEALARYGVDVAHVAEIDTATGHAIIAVSDADGENAIILYAGANHRQSPDRIAQALSHARPGDILLLQNETNCQVEAARAGADAGLRVIYSAAPFDAAAVGAVMPHLHLLTMNEVETAQLETSTGRRRADLPVRQCLITRGKDGAEWSDGRDSIQVAAHRVEAVDTTGAGDTFVGYVAAGLDEGLDMRAAMERAAAAAALSIEKPGAAQAVPGLDEVLALLDAASQE